MPFAPVASPAARQTVKGAFEGLKKVITPQDSRDFHKTTLKDVRKAALDIESQLAARQALRNMRRLMPLFRGLEHYEKAMGVLCNGTPYLPWVWAPITLILRVACEYVEAFEQIMKGYSRIASALKRFEILGGALYDKPDFQNTLAVFYADILQFHKHAYKFVRRNGWRLLFLTSWGRFQRRFDNIVEDMERHEALIDLEANAHNIAEERRLREDIKMWREKSVEEMQHRDEENMAKQYKAIMSWLKVDESDQLTIFDSISAEGTKHPGTCGWILQTPKVRSWLQKQRDTPMLWLQGSPGTGKTVLSAQLINFMKAAGDMFILYHFCTYSYPSSTLYEQILRSLLLQLFRKDGDLVAHVYNECVLGKKPPTLSALEQLLQVLLTSLSSEPCRTEHIWILLDGLDECEADKQARLVSLMNQVVSKTSSSGTTVCKVLVSSRPTTILTKRLGKKQILSLSDEKDALEDAIRQYASQRLQSLHRKLSQLDIGSEELSEIEHGVARKADGMFLYARLVLDYIATNIFFSGEEIRTSIDRLPDKLTDFYRRILTQILAHLDSRSVERIKCILGWIAFSKRPLKKLEFLSAISFSSGDPSISQLAPQYILDICEPLVEERRDSTLAFIHVSVKDFVQSASSNLIVGEEEALQQHAVAVLACLLCGLDVFNREYPEHSKAVRVVKGIHGLHLYATEHWTEYILSQASRTGGIDWDSDLFRLARQLADKLENLDSGRPHDVDPEKDILDDRLALLEPHETLRKHVKHSLASRTIEQMECELLNERGASNTPPSSGPSDSISAMLRAYQECVRSILSQHDVPGVTAEELDLFKRQFHASAFTCRLKRCPRATLGFDSAQLLQEHELSHVCRLSCPFPGCQYPPFVSAQALRSHERRHHQHGTQIKRPIRRVRDVLEAPPSTSVVAAARADRRRELYATPFGRSGHGHTNHQQENQIKRTPPRGRTPEGSPLGIEVYMRPPYPERYPRMDDEQIRIPQYLERSLPQPGLAFPHPTTPTPVSPSPSPSPGLSLSTHQLSSALSGPSFPPYQPAYSPYQSSAPNANTQAEPTGSASYPPAMTMYIKDSTLANNSRAAAMAPVAPFGAANRGTATASEPLDISSGFLDDLDSKVGADLDLDHPFLPGLARDFSPVPQPQPPRTDDLNDQLGLSQHAPVFPTAVFPPPPPSPPHVRRASPPQTRAQENEEASLPPLYWHNVYDFDVDAYLREQGPSYPPPSPLHVRRASPPQTHTQENEEASLPPPTGGVPPPTKTRGRQNRRDYPSSWGFDKGQMTMKKRVQAVFDGPSRLAKDLTGPDVSQAMGGAISGHAAPETRGDNDGGEAAIDPLW